MKIHPKFKATVDVYNKLAPQFVQHLEVKVTETEMDTFCELVAPGGKILDAGCGTARDSAELITRGYKAEGIDASKGLLKQAKKLHPEVPTKLMSLTELTFDNETFNGIWCRAAILHLDREAVGPVLKDFFRLLKPQGVLYLQTKEGVGEREQAVPFDPTHQRFFTFFTEEELVKLVQAAGFSVVRRYTYDTKDREKKATGQKWIVIYAQKAWKVRL